MANETIDRYQIIEQIGAGGMGTVYRAQDSEIGRDVALKWLPAYFTADTAFVERFKREARVIARLEHPHIVPIYDVGEHEGRPYIIMRLLTGGTLRERVGRPDFDLWALLKTLEQIADALETAHAKQIVHRDIKPGNILFDESGSAFLSDFGIAKVLDAATQLTGSGLIGTPAYMSPEQFIGQQIDGRSDQYSLAVVVYEALTGALPFTGNTAQMMYKHLNVAPPEIDLEKNPVPAGLNKVLSKALAKEPTARYAHVTDFVTALREAVTADSVRASAPLPLVAGSGAAATAPPTAPTELDTPSTEAMDTVDRDYRQGLEAMARADWAAAVAAFDRVLQTNPGYGSARDFRRQALEKLAPPPAPMQKTSIEVAPAQDAPAVPPPAPTSAPLAAPPRRSGLPGWAKIAALAVVLLLLGAGAVAALRLMGGDEEPAAPAVVEAAATPADASAATNTAEPTVAPTTDLVPVAAGSDGESPTNTPTIAATPTVAAATETPAAAETATPIPAPQVRVRVNSANLRLGPGTVYGIAGVILEGETATVLATNSDRSWYNVELADGTRAWLAASVSEPVDAAGFKQVEVAATIPAAPTATRVPPTATRPPAAQPTQPPPPPGGGGNGGSGGGNGGGGGGGSSTNTPEPPTQPTNTPERPY